MNRRISELGVATRLSPLLRDSWTHRASRIVPARIQMKQAYRQESTQTGDSQAKSSAPRPRIPPFLTLLLVAGIGATAYGIYDIYGMLTLWPAEVRTDLRGALKARNKGDLDLSERFLRRAWEKAKTLPIEAFKTDPYLKTSGIAVLLASVLELNGKPDEAYDVYEDALAMLKQAEKEGRLSGPEKLRAITISYRLGELASALQMPEEEERHLVWAVEAVLKSVLRLGGPPRDPERAREAESTEAGDPNTRIMISELSLPNWATKMDVAAPLEALGTLYARAGRLDYAMPLYLQAISILVPPSPQSSSDEDRCRGAQLMSNLSDLIIRSQPKPTEEVLHQAEAWATKGLEIAMHAKETSATPNPTCEVAFAVALFNVAALKQMAGDEEEAKKLYSLSLKHSGAIGLESGVEHARDALRQLTIPSDATPPSPFIPTG